MRALILTLTLFATIGCGPHRRYEGRTERVPDPVASSAPNPRPCHDTNDCSDGQECFFPDFEPGVGHLQCSRDGDCRGGAHCTGNVCVPRCTETSCPGDQQCGDDGECEALHCARDTECPHNFTCTGGRCVRSSCTTDAMCAGVCLHGVCFAVAGTCQPHEFCCPG